MKFLKTFALTLVLCYLFVFFGGWILFDFGSHFYLATGAIAFVIAVVAVIFVGLDERIRALEKQLKEQEEKE
ncbi:MAG: hypothetical protein LIO95_10580 [Clostridiales bacterium]|nr:hypothetical protein [Clostridiales bacterium]